MIFQVTFCDDDGAPIRETVYPADTLRQAVEFLLDGTVPWPDGAASIELDVAPAPG